MSQLHEIKKLIISTHEASEDGNLLLDLKCTDNFDREFLIFSKIITIGDEINISFGVKGGFKLFKNKYN